MKVSQKRITDTQGHSIPSAAVRYNLLHLVQGIDKKGQQAARAIESDSMSFGQVTEQFNCV